MVMILLHMYKTYYSITKCLLLGLWFLFDVVPNKHVLSAFLSVSLKECGFKGQGLQSQRDQRGAWPHHFSGISNKKVSKVAVLVE